MRMTRNAFKEYMRQNASRLYNEPNYTMAKYNANCDAVEIIPLDLSGYPQITKETAKYINSLFDEEDYDRNGNYMLRGFTRCEYAEMEAMNLEQSGHTNGYSFCAYNDPEMLIYTYCEGDTTLKPFADRESYEKEKTETLAWYAEAFD